MTNYYELLKLQPTASIPEIEAAINEQYNQWRRLVTHHDPNIVTQANQAIQLLEQIRVALTDTQRRAAYDEAIGVKGAMAGLADPQAIIQNIPASAVMTPPSQISRGNHPAQATGGQAAPNLWQCPKCKTENPPMSEFCFKCGTQLLRICPECDGMTSLVSTNVCGKCGYDYDVAQTRQDLKKNIRAFSTTLNQLSNDVLNAEKSRNWGGCSIFLFLAAVGVAIGGGYTFFFSYYYSGESLYGVLFISGIVVMAIIAFVRGGIKNKMNNTIRNSQQQIVEYEAKLLEAKQQYEQLSKKS